MKKVKMTPTLDNKAERKKLAAGIMQNTVKIGTKTLAWVPVELLNIKPYQRDRQKHVVQIAEKWDDSKCNVLLVSYDKEGACFNVVDGQHRAAAARMRGIEYLVCEIFTGLTMSDEAQLFVDQNSSTKKLTPFDMYKADQHIETKDENSFAGIDQRIKKVCDEYGIAVKKVSAHGTLKSVTVARTIIRRDGEEGLRFVFDVIRDSKWDEFPDGYSSDITYCLGKIYHNYKNNMRSTKTRVSNFLMATNPKDLATMANNNYPNLPRRASKEAVLVSVADRDDPWKPRGFSNVIDIA